jgi:hypothetical protein
MLPTCEFLKNFTTPLQVDLQLCRVQIDIHAMRGYGDVHVTEEALVLCDIEVQLSNLPEQAMVGDQSVCRAFAPGGRDRCWHVLLMKTMAKGSLSWAVLGEQRPDICAPATEATGALKGRSGSRVASG